nr:MAG TPA: hypothetical protein [Caudoviricetes sp.]
MKFPKKFLDKKEGEKKFSLFFSEKIFRRNSSKKYF